MAGRAMGGWEAVAAQDEAPGAALFRAFRSGMGLWMHGVKPTVPPCCA